MLAMSTAVVAVGTFVVIVLIVVLIHKAPIASRRMIARAAVIDDRISPCTERSH
jgi:hypothetical protein